MTSNALTNKTTKNSSRNLVLAVAFFGVLFFILNTLSVYVADDFRYMFSFVNGQEQARITNFSEWFQSAVAHYETTNGRVANNAAALFLMAGSLWPFRIANTIVYILLGVFLYKGFCPQYNKGALGYSLIQLFIFVFLPYYGQTVLWLDGSLNYLWPCTLAVAYFAIITTRFENEKSFTKKRWIGIIFLIGVFATSSLENLSVAILGITVLYMAVFVLQKRKIPLFIISGFLGSLIGFCFVMGSGFYLQQKIHL